MGKVSYLAYPRLDPPLVLVIELAEAHGHLPAAGAGGGDHHQGAGGLHVLVLAIALLADDEGDVIGVALDGVVAIDPQAQALQLGLEDLRRGLAAEPGEDHAAHLEAEAAEGVDKAEGVGAVGDAQIPPDLALLQVHGGDGHHDLHLVLQLAEHADLGVGVEPGEHPGGVVVVKELAAGTPGRACPRTGRCGSGCASDCISRYFVVVKPKFFDHMGTLPLFLTPHRPGPEKQKQIQIMYQFLYEKSIERRRIL